MKAETPAPPSCIRNRHSLSQMRGVGYGGCNGITPTAVTCPGRTGIVRCAYWGSTSQSHPRRDPQRSMRGNHGTYPHATPADSGRLSVTVMSSPSLHSWFVSLRLIFSGEASLCSRGTGQLLAVHLPSSVEPRTRSGLRSPYQVQEAKERWAERGGSII